MKDELKNGSDGWRGGWGLGGYGWLARGDCAD